ncbi:MAG: sulfite exporter TauE/SafE family protein [Alphaproteobacteria bacterium]
MPDLIAALGPMPAIPVIIAAILAGLVRGYTGFGAAMIFMPVGGAYFGPQAAVGVLMVIDGIMQLGMVRAAWGHARWGEMKPLFVGYFIGLPFGIYLLTTMDPTPLRWATSLSIVASLTVLASGRRIPATPGLGLTLSTGVVSGLVSGAASLGGMILSLFWLAGPARNEAVRGSTVSFFMLASIVSCSLLAYAGVFTADVFRLAAWLIAPYGIAMAAGSLLFGHAAPSLFRPAAFAVIAIAAITSLPALDPWLR